MKKEYSSFVYKEVWFILSKLPINLIAKIPFEIRSNIAQNAENCKEEFQEIDTTIELKEMNISEDAKNMLFSLYVEFLCNEDIKNKVNEYIKFN